MGPAWKILREDELLLLLMRMKTALGERDLANCFKTSLK